MISTTKVIVGIPLELSRALMNQPDNESYEYENIANGLVFGNRLVIQCDNEMAIKLVAWADALLPGARKQIEVVPDE